MKIPTATTVFFLAASVNAWNLKVYLTGGPATINAHGTTNSGCVNYDIDMRGEKVHRAKFDDSAFADTFELFGKKDCKGGVVYRNGDGSHKISPSRTVRSYKVY
ncbi:hypothetical protein Purlil1_12185 [Purpureocillium lilacinum]|uniref:Uncharacterized protein n=1 Tax=Purpureocillium lilacinum TaxID=33203 RepID=A0ABR0BHR0_PURLI|nr:hypothetical protein Purlil1_12185 [Purpureocillium lilacinum]